MAVRLQPCDTGTSLRKPCRRPALMLSTRNAVVPAGVSPNKDDGIIYDIAGGASKGGFGHPTCGGKEADVAVEIGAGAVVQ